MFISRLLLVCGRFIRRISHDERFEKPEQMNDEVWDFILLNGKMPKTTIPEDTLIKMRNEFNYWKGSFCLQYCMKTNVNFP